MLHSTSIQRTSNSVTRVKKTRLSNSWRQETSPSPLITHLSKELQVFLVYVRTCSLVNWSYRLFSLRRSLRRPVCRQRVVCNSRLLSWILPIMKRTATSSSPTISVKGTMLPCRNSPTWWRVYRLLVWRCGSLTRQERPRIPVISWDLPNWLRVVLLVGDQEELFLLFLPMMRTESITRW